MSQSVDAAMQTELTSQPMLGEALRRVRRERNLSLSTVAKATGISTSFLSVVENGRSDMTMGRLIHLLRYYGVRLRDLFPETDPVDRRVVVGPHERKLLVMPAQGIEVYLLAQHTNRLMLPVLGVHEPGAVLDDLNGHDGEIFIHMLEGSLLIERDGHDPFVLQENSSAYIDGRPPPRISNISDVAARLIGVISPPTF